jgi:hypothetical protein
VKTLAGPGAETRGTLAYTAREIETLLGNAFALESDSENTLPGPLDAPDARVRPKAAKGQRNNICPFFDCEMCWATAGGTWRSRGEGCRPGTSIRSRSRLTSASLRPHFGLTSASLRWLGRWHSLGLLDPDAVLAGIG